jgi:hypothetical protein
MFNRNLGDLLRVLICIIALLISSPRVGLAQQSPNALSNFRADFPLNKIEGAAYKNQTVRLDGNEYINCTFDNVVFQFDGQAPFKFTQDHFAPGSKVSIASTNPAIKAVIDLVSEISKLQQPQNLPNEAK